MNAIPCSKLVGIHDFSLVIARRAVPESCPVCPRKWGEQTENQRSEGELAQQSQTSANQQFMREILEARVGIEPTNKGFADVEVRRVSPAESMSHSRPDAILPGFCPALVQKTAVQCYTNPTWMSALGSCQTRRIEWQYQPLSVNC